MGEAFELRGPETSRRTFVKSAAAIGAVGALAGGLASTHSWLKPAQALAASEERVAYTFHQGHCGGRCSLKCTVRDERLCMLEPNDAFEDEDFSTICVKGLSEVQHIYSDSRIQTPLRRVGERGDGQYESITWDQALDEITSKIKEIWGKYGKEAVYFNASSENMMDYLADILGAQTAVGDGVDVGVGNGLDPALGFGGGWGAAANDVRDWRNAKTLLNIGSNYLESSLVQQKAFMDAQEAGVDIITIDPKFCVTAGKSSEWVPIEPGTDAALVLAMVSTVLNEKWYDEDFMRANTGMTFLVNVKTGALLREHGPSDGETPVECPYMVYDTAKHKSVPYTESPETAALKGTFEIEGQTYTTVFELVAKNAKDYTVDWAQEITGVPAEKIVDITRRYALNKPSCFMFGLGGCDKFANADILGHAMAIIVALTGNSGVPGAGAGSYSGGGNLPAPVLATWPLADGLAAATPETWFYNLPNVKNSVRAYISSGDTFQQYMANMNKTIDWVNSLDLFVYIDIYQVTGSQYADYVLPICSKFESETEIGGVVASNCAVRLRQKVIDPLFESRSEWWLQSELAKRLGIETGLPESIEEWATYVVENSEDPSIAGITMKALIENQGVYPMKGASDPYNAYLTQEYYTPSGKIELYYEDLLETGQELPRYEEAIETYADNPLREKYPLQMSQTHSRFITHTQFSDAAWIQQFSVPHVELNPAEMESRGLVDGDVVEVFNDRGLASCVAFGNSAIRPGVMNVFEGYWSKLMRAGNMQMLANDAWRPREEALMMGPVIPYNDTLVEVRKA